MHFFGDAFRRLVVLQVNAWMMLNWDFDEEIHFTAKEVPCDRDLI
jgi:hypothetical protein